MTDRREGAVLIMLLTMSTAVVMTLATVCYMMCR